MTCLTLHNGRSILLSQWLIPGIFRPLGFHYATGGIMVSKSRSNQLLHTFWWRFSITWGYMLCSNTTEFPKHESRLSNFRRPPTSRHPQRTRFVREGETKCCGRSRCQSTWGAERLRKAVRKNGTVFFNGKHLHRNMAFPLFLNMWSLTWQIDLDIFGPCSEALFRVCLTII